VSATSRIYVYAGFLENEQRWIRLYFNIPARSRRAAFSFLRRRLEGHFMTLEQFRAPRDGYSRFAMLRLERAYELGCGAVEL
jgi:hypothetical protein